MTTETPPAGNADPVVTQEQARETIRDALMDSQYLAGIKAGWNAAQADDPEGAYARLMAARSGHLSGYASAKRILASGHQRGGDVDPVVTQADINLVAGYASSRSFGSAKDVERKKIEVRLSAGIVDPLLYIVAQHRTAALLEGECIGMEKARALCAQAEISQDNDHGAANTGGAAQCYHAIDSAIRRTGATK